MKTWVIAPEDSSAEPVPAEQRHEHDRFEVLMLEPIATPADRCEHLR